MTEPKSQQEIARAVRDRAEELLGREEREPLDPIFIKQCLDANERGDGVLYATLYKDQFIYNVTPEKGEWYRWMNHVWQADDKERSFGAVEQCALEYLRMAMELQQEIDEHGIDKNHEDAWKLRLLETYKKRVNRLRSENGARKALYWSKIVDPKMACRESEFNKKPLLLPVQNGVIDLRTGALTNGRPADLMTKCLDLDYDPHADYEPWHKLLVEISDSEEVAGFLKRSFGCAITGHAFEQFIWVFIGPGRNGKGIMFNMIGSVLGPFYHELNAAMLIEQRNTPGPNAASEHMYSLMGKRLIVGSETNKGQKINGQAIKLLTGTDKITCRPNFRAEISFDPTHSLFLRTNHIPYGLTSDFALVERLLLILFPFRYVDDVEEAKRKWPGHADVFRKKDPKLQEKMMAYRPGILRWLVEGCLEWQEKGLCPPASILDGVTKLAREEDHIGEFIIDVLIHKPDDKELRLQCTTMYSAFKWWWSVNMDSRDQRIPAMKTITKSLRERGFIVDKSGGKTWIYYMAINHEVALEVDEFARNSG